MAQADPACAIISADRRSGFVMNIDVPRLADQEAADDEGHRRDDDGVPQPVIDVAGSRDDRKGGVGKNPPNQPLPMW